MKTIPKQKRKAIALFLKIIIIVAVLFCVYKVAEFMYDLWGFEEIEYEDASHVLEAFEENKSDFDSMVEVLQRTNINRILFDDYMDNPKPIMICPGDALKNPKYQIRRRGFLKGEDYKSICSFFEKYGPLYVEGTLSYCFAFNTKDDVVYLFYIPYEKREKIIDFHSNYTMTQLNDEWYFATYG